MNKLRGLVENLPFDIVAVRELAEIRALLESRGEVMGPFDLLLAGQAKSSKLTLVTANTKEFARVPELAIENWQAA